MVVSDIRISLSLSLGYELSRDFLFWNVVQYFMITELIIDYNKSCWVDLKSCQTILHHWSTHQPSVVVIQENWDLCFI